MTHTIKTERLIIRLARSEDAEAIFSYRSDCIENRYQGWIPNSVDEVRGYIINMPNTIDVANLCFQFVIMTVEQNRLIERIGFRKEAHFKESYYLRGEWVDDLIYAKLKEEWTIQHL